MSKKKTRNIDTQEDIKTPETKIKEEAIFVEQNLTDESNLQQEFDSIDNNAEGDLDSIDSSTKELNLDDQDIDVGSVKFDKEVIEERLEEAKQTETPKKKKKSSITNAIFLAINIALMVFIVNSFLTSIEDSADLPTVLANQGSKLWWLLAGLALYFVFILGESCIFTTLIKGTAGKRKPYLGYRVAVIGKYYDNITPFSVGGQPFQIVQLTKAGLSAGISTSLPVIKLIVYDIVYTIFILFSFIFGFPLILNEFTGLGRFLMIILIALAIVGLVFTAAVAVVFILIGNGKLIGRALARSVVKIGYKLRIVKDYRKTYNKIMIQVREYQNSMDFLKKNKGVMIKCVIFSFLEILAYFSIPVMCVFAFGNIDAITFEFWFITMTKFLTCQMAAVILPLPGGTGMMEIGFILAFGSANILGPNAGWGLLAWRILTYYIIIAHGFVQTIVDTITNSCKNRKLEKMSNINKVSS